MKRTYGIIIFAILGLSFAWLFAPSAAWSCHEQNRFSGERIPHNLPGGHPCQPLSELDKQKQMKESIIQPQFAGPEHRNTRTPAFQKPDCVGRYLTRELRTLKSMADTVKEKTEFVRSNLEEQNELLRMGVAIAPVRVFSTGVDEDGNRCCMDRMAPPNKRYPANGCDKYLGRGAQGPLGGASGVRGSLGPNDPLHDDPPEGHKDCVRASMNTAMELRDSVLDTWIFHHRSRRDRDVLRGARRSDGGHIERHTPKVKGTIQMHDEVINTSDIWFQYEKIRNGECACPNGTC